MPRTKRQTSGICAFAKVNLITDLNVRVLAEREANVYELDEDEQDEDDRYFEEGLLPVVNSPRVGVCGYTG